MRNYNQLLKYIFEGIFEKKGQEVVNIDFKKLAYAACDNFIICHGDSGTQVKALAEAVEDKLDEILKTKVIHREGLENASWVLLDYGEVIVHIFQKDTRAYYKLEELWGDADISPIKED